MRMPPASFVSHTRDNLQLFISFRGPLADRQSILVRDRDPLSRRLAPARSNRPLLLRQRLFVDQGAPHTVYGRPEDASISSSNTPRTFEVDSIMPGDSRRRRSSIVSNASTAAGVHGAQSPMNRDIPIKDQQRCINPARSYYSSSLGKSSIKHTRSMTLISSRSAVSSACSFRDSLPVCAVRYPEAGCEGLDEASPFFLTSKLHVGGSLPFARLTTR